MEGPNSLYDFLDEMPAVLSTCVAATAWLVQKGHLDLAWEMRDDFMQSWEIDATMWNHALADAVDYAQRKAPHPESAIRDYMELVVR